MLTTEPIKEINKRLIEHFGVDTITGQAMWRVVYSEDQYEKRLTKFTDSGLELLHPEVRLLPKYKQWIDHKFILEHLVLVPDASMPELPAEKTSYEPLWTFEDKNGNALPPKWEACKFIIDTVNAAMYSDHNLPRYKDPDADPEQARENHRKKIESTTEALFGDESNLLGRTITGEAVGFTTSKILE